MNLSAQGLGDTFHHHPNPFPSTERGSPLGVPQGPEEGAEGRDLLRPYLFRLISPKRCRRLLLPGVWGCPPTSFSPSPKSGVAEKRSGSDGSLRVSLSPLFSPQDRRSASGGMGTKGVDRWLAGQPRQCPPASATSHREAQTFYSVPTSGHRLPDTRGKQPC